MSLWEELKSSEEEMKEDIEKVIEKLEKIDLYDDRTEIDLYNESEDIRSIVSAAIKDLQKIGKDLGGW